MNEQNAPQPTDKTATGAPAPISAIRRFYNAWKRWEEIMDYGPFDYTFDRMGQLERRVLELERTRNAIVESPP
ncbi:MAG: hypothetical protein V4508_21735 [Pseudomonadota bacterium]